MPSSEKIEDQPGDIIGKRVFINKLNSNGKLFPSQETQKITLNNTEHFLKGVKI